MDEVLWIPYRGKRVRWCRVPVSPPALAVLYCMTKRHIAENNPWLDTEQLEAVTVELVREVAYRLYREKRP